MWVKCQYFLKIYLRIILECMWPFMFEKIQHLCRKNVPLKLDTKQIIRDQSECALLENSVPSD